MPEVSEEEKREKIAAIMKTLKPLASEYYRLTGKPLGVTGELAEYAAADKLGLTLAAAREPDYDALRGTERIQIKGRSFTPKSTAGQRMGRLKVDAQCDAVLLVILDPITLDPNEMWEAPFAVVKAHLEELAPAAQVRGLPIDSFKKLAKRVWPNQP